MLYRHLRSEPSLRAVAFQRVAAGWISYRSRQFGPKARAHRPLPDLRSAPLWRAEFDLSDSVQWFATPPGWPETWTACASRNRRSEGNSAPEIPPPIRYGPDTASASAQDNRAQGKNWRERKRPRSKCVRRKNARTGGHQTSVVRRCTA